MKIHQLQSVIPVGGQRLCLALVLATLVLAGCQGTERPRPLVQEAAPAKAETRAAAKPEARPVASADARALTRSKPAPAFAPYYAPAQKLAAQPATYPGVNRFPDKEANGVVSVAEHPVSTFSVDVDTASYAFVRRYLTSGQLPPPEAVRVEEMVNYFPYAYPGPQDRTQPFRITHSVMPSPWAAENQLLHIALRGYDIARADRPRTNVV
ncbi:MAG: hypothetical protein JWN13_1962, partial [Betaproteobacteria bacterium]|nr:hypothetical protein [Betaproteobacteria bacterium]